MSALIANIRRADRLPFHAMSMLEARAAYGAGAEILEPPRAALAHVEELHVPAIDGTPLRARLYAASHVARPCCCTFTAAAFDIDRTTHP